MNCLLKLLVFIMACQINGSNAVNCWFKTFTQDVATKLALSHSLQQPGQPSDGCGAQDSDKRIVMYK